MPTHTNNNCKHIIMESEQSLNVKDELVEQLVLQRSKHLKEVGEMESIEQIFGRLPISRIEKNQYQFLFDNIKQNVENGINQEENIRIILQREHEAIQAMKVSHYNNFKYDDLLKMVYNERVLSGKAVTESVIFMRNRPFSLSLGGPEPFLGDKIRLQLSSPEHEIGNIRLMLMDSAPLMRFSFQFVYENYMQFKNRQFPSRYELQKRAEILAKSYLLQLYREEELRAKQIYRQNDQELNKQREIKKIQQELEVEKIKQGEMIQEMDLIKQVYKVLLLIERKMNQQAYEQFELKNGGEAAKIKRSLEKLKLVINDEPSAKVKLKTLITYKHAKGW